MSRRTRRLIGRAHRRRARGLPITSNAVRGAVVRQQHPSVWRAFQIAVDRIHTVWANLRVAVLPALRSTLPGHVLPPPPQPRRRAAGPLLHNGRKPR